MAEKYGNPERATLLVLMLNGGELSNPDLKNKHGVELTPAGRAKLNNAGLLVSRTDKRPFVHEITSAGIDWCEQALADIETPTGKGPIVRAGFELLRRFVRYARGNGIPLVRVIEFVGGLESLIRSVYTDLADGPSDYVRLAEIRPKLNGANKDEVDQKLVEMMNGGLVDLAPDSNRRGLTDADHAAAIRVGTEDKHFMAIEES
jgi:hypothetical protein